MCEAWCKEIGWPIACAADKLPCLCVFALCVWRVPSRLGRASLGGCLSRPDARPVLVSAHKRLTLKNANIKMTGNLTSSTV